MSTTPVNSSTPATTSSATSTAAAANAQAQASLNTNYTDFLKLLTTQLQNQGPTNPTDTSQVTSEIAQMSEVQAQLQTNTYLSQLQQEQLQTNTNLTQLLASLTANQTSDAVSYIGKQVDVTPATGTQAQTELTNSQATLVYDLPAGTSTANVTITNSAGQTVFSGPGTTVAGRNQLIWNGANTNSATGVTTTAADGTYNFTVTATDSSGNPLTATTLTTGTVQAVDTQNGTNTLALGGTLSVPISSVQAVYTPGTNPSAVSSNNSGTNSGS